MSPSAPWDVVAAAALGGGGGNGERERRTANGNGNGERERERRTGTASGNGERERRTGTGAGAASGNGERERRAGTANGNGERERRAGTANGNGERERRAGTASGERVALSADSARIAVPPPSAAGPPCALPRTTSCRTPVTPTWSAPAAAQRMISQSSHSRDGVRHGSWRGTVATGVAQPRRSSAEGVPFKSIQGARHAGCL
jgi:hypothetical protein